MDDQRRNALPTLPPVVAALPPVVAELTLNEPGNEKKTKSKSKSPTRDKKIVKAEAPRSPKKDKEKPEKEKSDKEKPDKEKPEKEKSKKEKKEVPNSPKKEKSGDAISDHSRRVPFELFQAVKKSGRDPFYRFLLVRLKSFKNDEKYREDGVKWDLIDWDNLQIEDYERPYRVPEELKKITAEELYEKFMFGKKYGNHDGARYFSEFLGNEFYHTSAWECMSDFEVMMKETTSYTTFVKLFKKIVDKLSDHRDPFPNEYKEEFEALKFVLETTGIQHRISLGSCWIKRKPNQKQWKEEANRTEKAAQKALDNAGKEKEQLRFDNGCAPSLLLSKVKEFGRDPLHNYLLSKIKLFKKTDEYRANAKTWDLITVSEEDRLDPTVYTNIPAEVLYEKLMFPKRDGHFVATDVFVRTFLSRELDDDFSWPCMLDFETMMSDTTTYTKFMKLFQKNMAIFSGNYFPFARANQEAVAALKECYDTYKDLDLKAARKQK
ncbi:hypothetical protein MHU86_11361 [Fragilaria crotonensis]|nr:hypothetical protein MHU86_11361 [Fragilaria crotonensis]